MIKRSTVYGAALAMVLAGSFAVPAQAAMKMVVVGGGSCGQGSSSGSGQISLNDLLSGWAGDRGGAGTGGSGCAAPWSGSLSGWRLPGGNWAGGNGSCTTGGNGGCITGGNGNCIIGGNGSCITGGNGSCIIGGSSNWGCPDISIPDGDVPGVDQPTQPDGDHWYPSYDEDADLDGYLQQVVSLTNQERSKAGLPALKASTQLSAAAAVRAREIVTSFGHVRPDDSSFSTAIGQNGVSFNGAGENIAYGQTSPQEVMNAWMNSQTHRDAILSPYYTNIGVACYQDSNGVLYWTQLFTY